MAKRHPVQIPDDLWQKLCEDAAEQMKKRKEPVSPSQRLREILRDYFAGRRK
jgi:hypothetical protein